MPFSRSPQTLKRPKYSNGFNLAPKLYAPLETIYNRNGNISNRGAGSVLLDQPISKMGQSQAMFRNKNPISF
jgi:hypothetical protein